MHWQKRDLWKAAVVASGVLFLMLMTLVTVSVADAHGGVAGVASAGTVTAQATPTEDATVTSLQKQQLILQNKQLQQSEDRGFNAWLWNNAAAIVASFLSTLVVVIGALIGFWQWRTNRNDTRTKEANDQKEAQNKELLDRQAERERREEEQRRWLEDQKAEREKRDEERFQAVVDGLSSLDEPKKVGAAIMLRTFLREGYERFYPQTFDLAVAHLRLHRMVSKPPKDPNDPLPITTLSYALIAVFKEVFPHVRDSIIGDKERSTQTLDATGVQLDSGYLAHADLKEVWMPNTSLRGANLDGARFTKANLANVDFRKVQFRFADFTDAILEGANLSGIFPSRYVIFRFANLNNADLHDANLSRHADLYNARLNGANLVRAILTKANLTVADFSGADLTGADLSGAILQEPTISGTSFRGANLSEANLSEVDMKGVYLDDAILKGTKMYNVRGLTKDRVEDFKARGAIVDAATMANASQSTIPPATPPQPSS